MIVELENDNQHHNKLSLAKRIKTVQTKEWSCLSQLHIHDLVRWCPSQAEVGEGLTFSMDP
jgi:hypothetical protein